MRKETDLPKVKMIAHVLLDMPIAETSFSPAMMMNILAAGMELTDEDLRELRGRCVREVKETRGRISFEDAVDYQKGAN